MFNLPLKFTKPGSGGGGGVAVGLDLGSESLKLLKLRPLKDGLEISNFSLECGYASPKEALEKAAQAQQGALNVYASLCGPATIVRYIDFPVMGDDEIKKALKFEAPKHVPFPMEEIILDSCLLKENLAENKNLVLLAAAKKDLVAQRLALLGEAGFKAQAMDIDSVALINAFNYSRPATATDNKPVALLNIGAAEASLNIMEGPIPRLSRDIHIAGNNLTQKIADSFAIDTLAAQALKLNPDKERMEKIVGAIGAGLAGLAAEIRTSFDYYESQRASSVARIYLGGGSARFPGIKDMLANLLGFEVELWNPLQNIPIADKLDASRLQDGSLQWGVALGLALRGIA
jgi:type IV pilus assembly protein PilM